MPPLRWPPVLEATIIIMTHDPPPPPAPPRPQVLVAVSSARFIQLSHGRRQATGHFLIELSHPLDCLLKAGYRVEVRAGQSQFTASPWSELGFLRAAASARCD
jgi:hypothetical protein